MPSGPLLAPDIVDRVTTLIDRYALHESRVLPVPVRQVARDEGWWVLYRDRLASAYGYAVVLPGMQVMVINSAIASHYQRYTMAHEMGHVLCRHVPHGVRLCAASTALHEALGQAECEAEADRVAALILIPAWTLDLPDKEIARRCGVPERLVRIRRGQA